jgi:hypothetical protein
VNEADRRIDHRALAFGLGTIRIGNGLLLLLAPRVAALLYLGPIGREPTGRALERFIGVRELALGAGTLSALRSQRADAEWVSAIAFCEGLDALISLVSPGLVRRTRAASVTAVAAAVVGVYTARELARDRRAVDVSTVQ